MRLHDRFTLLSLLSLLASLLLPGTALAVPFDLIVPTTVNLNTFGGSATNFGAYGWIMPTSGSFTDTDLESAILLGSFSNPSVTLGTMTTSATGTFTITPGQFAGFYADFTGTNNVIYTTQLQVGESLDERWDYRIGFTYPLSYVGTGTLNASVEIGGEIASSSSEINFIHGGRSFEAFGAQRVSSVPEPSTALLVTLGLAGLAVAGRPRPSPRR